MKQYKDYQLKGQILQAIHAGITTAKDIHKFISYPYPLDNLYAELCFLNNYGYLSVEKINRSSHYSLTKKGVQHALNPNICQDIRKELEEVKLKRKLDTDPMFREAVTKYLTEHYPVAVETTNVVTQQVPVSVDNTPIIENTPAETPVEINQYDPNFKPVYILNPNSVQDFANIKKSNTRKAEIERRRALARQYLNAKGDKKFLYGGFFKQWGGNFKLWLLEDGMIDILGASNEEKTRREHNDRLVTHDEQWTNPLYIESIAENGIYVIDRNKKMKVAKFLRF
ncbi:Uncharacterised protein [uncultured archaeon]|nr:Uncharacterised protein [uncultured archaeon]